MTACARNDGVRARNNRAFGQPAHFRHREAAGCGDLRPISVIARPQAVAICRCRSSGVDCRASLAMTECALAMTACARKDGARARKDGARARNNRAFGQPAPFRHREAAGRGDLRPISVIARSQAVAIYHPFPSSRGRRPWRSIGDGALAWIAALRSQ
jgi:hypothetical protein